MEASIYLTITIYLLPMGQRRADTVTHAEAQQHTHIRQSPTSQP